MQAKIYLIIFIINYFKIAHFNQQALFENDDYVIRHEFTTMKFIEEMECGQYGFRCHDIKSFQICTYPDSNGHTESPEIIHECHENTICDEDNPAYCTVIDLEYTTKLSDCYPLNKEYNNNRLNNNYKIVNNDNSNTIDVKKRQIYIYHDDNDYDDEYKTTTETTELPPTTTLSTEYLSDYKFHCDEYGSFPGTYL